MTVTAPPIMLCRQKIADAHWLLWLPAHLGPYYAFNLAFITAGTYLDSRGMSLKLSALEALVGLLWTLPLTLPAILVNFSLMRLLADVSPRWFRIAAVTFVGAPLPLLAWYSQMDLIGYVAAAHVATALILVHPGRKLR
ncbi:hypothetical protein [Actinoplanes regularis]|uniref:Uncharacterized protein n=1 Tax=Actinoplanes regularis TaxID=52697 RepID=A0A238W186_9ACTN|nr:hypothetical protein [Actinoplanes regularis]GIE85355.1 hypothetical protein Are01nite_18350 [Actinoplanes regularis]SNR40286.1 hypothetical protein SAMN06264365_10272 [Actinoplanes regularis]